MRNRRLAVLALVIGLIAAQMATGLLEAAGARGRILWQNKCPAWGGEVVVNQVGDVYVVQCYIGD